MDTESDGSSPLPKNHGDIDSDQDDLDLNMEEMRLAAAGAGMGHQQQQDIQKLIEEVTKKEEKWTKDQVSITQKYTRFFNLYLTNKFVIL